MFAVPWYGKTILGTTDTPRKDLAREPEAFADDVGFILRESARYLARAPQRSDVRSIWVGLRPLVKPGRRRRRQHQGAVARTHGHRRPLRPGHGDRRQVDHLPQHGRRRAGAGHGRRPAAAAGPLA
jgi:glycerol-3-phosphate dehydrogenase